jgi:regulator of protease activity HflC (stomatin/prohibitin superfamily)
MDIASLVTLISAVAWLAAIGLVAFFVVQASRGKPVHRGGVILLVVVLVAVVLSTVSSGLVFIDPDQRGVVISAVAPKGYREVALLPGLHWVIPFAENVIQYPISRQTYTMSIATNEGAVQGDDSITARTADGQEIYVDASVIFAIDPDKVVQVHILWKNRYEDELVRAQARGVIRDVISQYRVEEVVTSKRFEMAETLRTTMEKKLSDNGLVLIDFILRNITFSPEYAASVEQKQIAEQTAQQAKFVVEQKRQEAEQARQVAQGSADAAVIASKGAAEARVIQAQAEAQSLELIAKALQSNPNLLTYEYISKLSPTIQTMLLPSNAPFVFQLPGTAGLQPNSGLQITP